MRSRFIAYASHEIRTGMAGPFWVAIFSIPIISVFSLNTHTRESGLQDSFIATICSFFCMTAPVLACIRFENRGRQTIPVYFRTLPVSRWRWVLYHFTINLIFYLLMMIVPIVVGLIFIHSMEIQRLPYPPLKTYQLAITKLAMVILMVESIFLVASAFSSLFMSIAALLTSFVVCSLIVQVSEISLTSLVMTICISLLSSWLCIALSQKEYTRFSWPSLLFRIRFRTPQPFRSPGAALLWYEWKRSYGFIIVSSILIFVITPPFSMFTLYKINEINHIWGSGLLSFSAALLLFLGLFQGKLRSREKSKIFDRLIFTMPVPTQAYAKTQLCLYLLKTGLFFLILGYNLYSQYHLSSFTFDFPEFMRASFVSLVLLSLFTSLFLITVMLKSDSIFTGLMIIGVIGNIEIIFNSIKHEINFLSNSSVMIVIQTFSAAFLIISMIYLVISTKRHVILVKEWFISMAVILASIIGVLHSIQPSWDITTTTLGAISLTLILATPFAIVPLYVFNDRHQ